MKGEAKAKKNQRKNNKCQRKFPFTFPCLFGVNGYLNCHWAAWVCAIVACLGYRAQILKWRSPFVDWGSKPKLLRIA